ncbi:hypothetical protein BH11ACT4_BH11ACT4_13070 [soil metagenome]
MNDRAGEAVDRFNRSCIDATVMLVHNPHGDLIVHDGALRDIRFVLAAHAGGLGMPTLGYALATGARVLTAPGSPAATLPDGIAENTPPTVALDRIREHVIRSGTPHHIQLDWAEHHLPADHVGSASGDTARVIEQLAELATDPAMRAGGHVVAVFTRGAPLGRPLAQLPGFSPMTISLPGQDEREKAIELMRASSRRPLVLSPGFDTIAAARATGALSLHAISVAREHTSAQHPLTPDAVRAAAQVEFGRALNGIARVDPTRLEIGVDLVGLAPVVRILQDHALEPDMPLRYGFYGPPGTGKSVAARGIATHLEVPLILPETLKEQWVGASERNTVHLLTTLESLAPSLTVIDDQNDSLTADRESGSHGDANGISGSLTGLFLDRFGDPSDRPGMHMIIASNFARRTDPAMRSRLKCIAFLPPEPRDLAAQLEAMARTRGWPLETGVAIGAFTTRPRRLSSRDLINILLESRLHALRAHRTEVSGQDVVDALDDYNPSVDIAIERQTLEALEATTFTSYLPWMAARHLGFRDAEPPGHLSEFVRSDGALDRDRIAERLLELEALRGR